MRRTKIIIAALVVFVSLVVSPAIAADPHDYFDRLIRSDKLMTMDFRQTTFDDDGIALEETEGVLRFLRPAFFRMEYDSPQQPLLASDGEQIWYYEADLNQAVVSPLQSAEKSGLLALFSGGGIEALRERYIVTRGVGSNGLVWLNAEPRNDAESVRRIQLGFTDDGVLRQIKVADAFGGVVQLDITAVVSSTADADFFAFTPPLGTEIIRHGE